MHVSVCNNSVEAHGPVGNHIVPMFAECGSTCDTQQSFNSLVYRNEHSWTSLISAFVECGQPQHAFGLYSTMRDDGVHPSSYTLVALLRACAKLKDLENGQDVHVEVTKLGLEGNLYVGCTLIDMYAKCGSLDDAQKAFHKLSVKNVITWNALIAGYVDNGLYQEALKCYEQMQMEGVPRDAVSFVCGLKACGSVGAIDKGLAMHIEIEQRGFGNDPYVGNTLVDMYAKCGLLAEARNAFEKLLTRDVVSWNTLIGGYVENGQGMEALKCFEKMQLEGVLASSITYVCILKACGILEALDKGRKIHKEIVDKGYEGNVYIGSALVDMYVKCTSLAEARKAFNELPLRNVVSWNSMIAGYVEHGCGQEALECFNQMQREGVCPDAVTFICTLKACGIARAAERGQEIHTEVAQRGLERDLFVGSTLVDMYAKCGSVEAARKVFDKLFTRNVVSWTALIAGYTENGCYEEALKCFEQMQLEGVYPDVVTFICSLKACGSIGAIDKGREIHTKVAERGFDKDLFVASALLGMYADCGYVTEAQDVFDRLSVQDVVSWSAMIRGYGVNHESNMAIQCFEDLQIQGICPDAATFTSLLSACSRGSMVFEGQEYFWLMRERYGIAPTADHYTCMIDLFARSGHLHVADILLGTMPCPPSLEAWTALLSACKTYGEAELGHQCFQKLILISSQGAASYALMADIFASIGMWDDANEIEELETCVGN